MGSNIKKRIYYNYEDYMLGVSYGYKKMRGDNDSVDAIRILVDTNFEDDVWNKPFEDLPYQRFGLLSKNSHEMLLPTFFTVANYNEYVEELKKRYSYAYENFLFWLAPFMVEREVEQRNNGKLEKVAVIYCQPSISFLHLLENFLLSKDNMEDTILYKYTEKLKNNGEYLEKVKTGLSLAEKKKENGEELSIFDLFKMVRCFVEGQVKHINKDRKLKALGNYFNIARYTNDGRTWNSGYRLSEDDIMRNLDSNDDIFGNDDFYIMNVDSEGIKNNSFIVFLSNNHMILSEEEKQELYLKYHDELPWNLQVLCDIEEMNPNVQNDNRLIRPKNTNACSSFFYLEEDEIIFVKNRGFYTLCPFCGYIVKVNYDLLSDGIKKRIMDRTSEDEFALRKVVLYSELKALDDKSLPHQKILNKDYKKNKSSE